ncbi:MAG TPA: thioredoxin family protein [Burkholderiaceae bacterium]|nr:thioredoxin family protein [Burkholderiaceae bacterium]
MRAVTLAAVVLPLIAACTKAPEVQPPAPAARKAEIEWVHASAPADIDGAFGRARQEAHPVFLFWTAAWCPPCSQVKSTIFTRTDFIERSRSFVPVYVDGDTPSGQSLGRRFGVSGYPTMVLLRPDGSEITRLAGSVDPAKYMQVLDHGLAGGASARQALEAALAGQPLSPDDWRLLAYYSWEGDDDGLIKSDAAAATMLKLAQSCPPAQRESASRLTLLAIAAAAKVAEKNPGKPVSAAARADALASLQSILARPDLMREHYDLIAQYADTLVTFTTAAKSPARKQLVDALDAALDQLAQDSTLPNAARVWVVSAKVDIARIDNKTGPLPDALLAQVREQAAWADRSTSGVEERQSVITAAGSMLADAGLLDESDALLAAELTRSHSPYYYMVELAANARKRKTPEGNAAAIEWSRKAYQASQGPATRLQWGGIYVNALIELAPTDSARIESTSAGIIDEAAQLPDGFSGRSRRSLERLSTRLQKWNGNHRHDATLVRLHEKMADVCTSTVVEAGDRAACEQLFTTGKPGKHA